MSLNLADIHKKVMPILSQAEKILLDAYYGETKVFDKDGIQNTTAVVTETDHKIDKFFRKKLKQIFPQVGFISEEIEHKLEKEFNWIIDPIDGTLNFSRKIPIFGISIALWKRNEPIYGIISLPLLHIRLHAMLNDGAYLNNKKITYKYSEDIKNPYILWGHVGDKHEKMEIVKRVTELYSYPLAIGCAIFYGAMAILGKADCAMLLKLSLWDIGALVIIAKENGLATKYLSKPPNIVGGKYQGYKHSLIMGNPKIVQMLSQELLKII